MTDATAPDRPTGELTQLLTAWRAGDEDAGRQLMVTAHAQLKRLATHYLRNERRDHTLQATELVNELFVKMFRADVVQWTDRVHFFAVAATQLRRILVDSARARHAGKRGGRAVRVSLTEAQNVAQSAEPDILDIDRSLRRLEAIDPRAAAGVELRFFGGLTESEIASALGISLRTLHRDWVFARAWLVSELVPRPDDKGIAPVRR
jgi:RNA polymerase sigma factor (TIGR02999 family)